MLERHSPERLAEIGRFAGAVAVEVEDVGRVFCCHGSPRGDQEIVTPRTPERRMRRASRGGSSSTSSSLRTSICSSCASVLGITSMNAGSVGLPYGATPGGVLGRARAR